MKSNLIKKYRDRYSISYLDLAEAGESNRIILRVICPFLFIFAFSNLIALFIMQYKNIEEYKHTIIYFTFYIGASIYGFIHSTLVKDTPRDKAYIYKTIPIYIIIDISLFAGFYNSYFIGHTFNGFVTFCLTCCIAICIFSFSPIPFSISLIFNLFLIAPQILRSFGPTGVANTHLSVILLICLSLYKRRNEKKSIMFLQKQKKNLEAKTFGNFTLIYKNSVVKFSRTKSNELMAYLVYKKGSSVNTKELISVLWGDHADSARYGNNLRNLIVDIKRTLNDLQILNFFIAEYNNFRINPEVIKCDYYDFLDGDSKAIHSYAGEFMGQYSWGEEVSAFLEMKAIK